MACRHLSLATYFPRLPTAVSSSPTRHALLHQLRSWAPGPSSQSASTRPSFHSRLGSVPSPPPGPRRAREHSHSPTSPRRAREQAEEEDLSFVKRTGGRREGEGGGSEMNVFRLAGDMTHLLSVVVLLLKIHTIKSCAGISLKTQELYALVFAARYLDLFVHFVSLYNTVMKLVFLASSFSIVWYMKQHKIVRRTYDKDHDTFRHYVLVLPCLLLALLINEKFTFREVMWAFSIYLEAVAIFPQLVLLQRTRNIDNLTGQYIFFLGAYRMLYILNWIYRYFTEPHFVHWISWVAGIVQTLLYADFFCYYIMSWKNNVKLELPA